MASTVTFQPPVSLHGTSEQQLKQMYSYLYQMSEKLNVALEQVDGNIGQTVITAMAKNRSGDKASDIDQTVGQRYKALRDLIIKTADEIYVQMDLIEKTLKSDYLAISEFGTFKETLETTIRATAQNVIVQYNYDSRLDAIDTDLAGFKDYDISSLQYIKFGFIGEDDYGAPIVGIIIGREFTTVTVDGEEYNKGVKSYSAFTSDKISFFVNDVECAYLANDALYVTHITLPEGGKFKHGNWQTDTDNGYTIRWVGGD